MFVMPLLFSVCTCEMTCTLLGCVRAVWFLPGLLYAGLYLYIDGVGGASVNKLLSEWQKPKVTFEQGVFVTKKQTLRPSGPMVNTLMLMYLWLHRFSLNSAFICESYPLCQHGAGQGNEAPALEEGEALHQLTGSPSDLDCSWTGKKKIP